MCACQIDDVSVAEMADRALLFSVGAIRLVRKCRAPRGRPRPKAVRLEPAISAIRPAASRAICIWPQRLAASTVSTRTYPQYPTSSNLASELHASNTSAYWPKPLCKIAFASQGEGHLSDVPGTSWYSDDRLRTDCHPRPGCAVLPRKASGLPS